MAPEPRVTAQFWVDAYLSRLRLADIPVFLRSRGDATAGAVLVKLNTLDGNALLYQRVMTASGERERVELESGDDAAVEDALSRQLGYDPDLWVLEVEDARGRTLLDEPGLNS